MKHKSILISLAFLMVMGGGASLWYVWYDLYYECYDQLFVPVPVTGDAAAPDPANNNAVVFFTGTLTGNGEVIRDPLFPVEFEALRLTRRTEVYYSRFQTVYHHTPGSRVVTRRVTVDSPGRTFVERREPQEVDPTYYEIPYRTMVHRELKNCIMAGRMISTDRGAFGAVRVMVNLNQVGEAAGTAAHLSLESGKRVAELNGTEIRAALNDGGSCLL